MNQAQAISLYQPVLQSIALRIVGSIADAEDIVQDTFLKWLSTDQKRIDNTKSYLIKSVTNNSINHLNSIKRKKNEFLDTINHSQIMEKYRESDFAKFDFENEIAAALSVMHKKLEPMEKSIYILREFFDLEYDHLQEIFDKKKDNLRQLFSRAKDKLNQENKKIKSIATKPIPFLESFRSACNKGHVEQFVQHLKKDLV
ncbi:MAG: sigma-70 family RNA polymerase sigma factor [Cyclobacteriaceae bacterium]|nr:sigma-70 family RNA polymerase sigma factor [Cyclobacteriaceae bacterium]